MDSRSRARLFRRHHFTSANDALRMAAAVSQRVRPGSATLVFLNRNRGLLDILVVEDGADHLVEVLELVFTIDDRGASGRRPSRSPSSRRCPRSGEPRISTRG